MYRRWYLPKICRLQQLAHGQYSKIYKNVHKFHRRWAGFRLAFCRTTAGCPPAHCLPTTSPPPTLKKVLVAHDSFTADHGRFSKIFLARPDAEAEPPEVTACPQPALKKVQIGGRMAVCWWWACSRLADSRPTTGLMAYKLFILCWLANNNYYIKSSPLPQKCLFLIDFNKINIIVKRTFFSLIIRSVII